MKMSSGSNKIITTKQLVLIALFVVVLIICSWINIPGPVPFTLQTFAIFYMSLILGGKYSTLVLSIYILLGAIGVPVFSGFKGGIGALFGVTGGYILGFYFTTVFFIILKKMIKNDISRILICVIGLIFCYAFGTVWFIYVYGNAFTLDTIISTLSICVFPFIIPDLIKIALAYILYIRTRKYIND